MKLAAVFEGWTLLDYALLVWFLTGFITFTTAATIQIPEKEKWVRDEAKNAGASKAPVVMPSMFYVTSSNAGIVGGVALLMLFLVPIVFFVRLYFRFGHISYLYAILFFGVLPIPLIFQLFRAIRKRLGSSAA